MENFGPEAIKKLKQSRRESDVRLKSGGAETKFDGKGGLITRITPEQRSAALREMNLALLEKRKRVVDVDVDMDFEIGEMKLFRMEDIVRTIAKFEGIDQRDLHGYHFTVDKKDRIVRAEIDLTNTELNSRYKGYLVRYFFEIAGKNTNPKFPHTIFFTNIKKMAYREDEPEEEADTEDFLRFYNTEWQRTELAEIEDDQKEDEDDDEFEDDEDEEMDDDELI